ncbi:Frag1/DRAM/Sfk1 family-domain-containing protein [Kockovaella imperatae]|uniref:Frag1/DRAM/Sfk1 family-domain-containing protein n=1 Tax=Kockovaella imperatae TaxID=4999 RepID=A0A1Y1UBG5_9TREE|nr:Frag1/DRAM/Sfk1 family-domain-containing protein [Kockovaella imperatae]ORX35398.1 Frag1/DRAM/Sfk1 family-domain-containing protein [Kockovaella imperatae]
MARKPLYLNSKTLTSHLFFGPYIFFPILAGLTWLGGILALLGLWVHAGKPRYEAEEASVVFISDVGAAHHKLFIGICCTTAGLYVMSIIAERWLRHVDRLPADKRKRERVFDWMAIVFGAIGALGLVFLSIFDAFDYPKVHWSMTVVFVVFVALSAIFQSAEVWSLYKDHPDRPHLLRNSILKLIIVTLAICTAIAFAVTYGYCDGNSVAVKGHSAAKCNRVTSAAAALEWTVAFILVFYFFTLAADLWPAGKSSPRYMRRLAKWQEKHGEGDDFTGRRAFSEYPERWQGAAANEEVGGGGGWRARAERMKIASKEKNQGIAPGRDSMASGAPLRTANGGDTREPSAETTR